MLTEKTNRIAEMIHRNRGKERPQVKALFTLPENNDNQASSYKRISNMDMALPLVLNARALGLDGFQSSLLLTLVNLIVESESNLLPPNLKELSGKIGCAASTLERHIGQLKEFGFIEVDKALDGRGFARNIYRFRGIQEKLQNLGVEI